MSVMGTKVKTDIFGTLPVTSANVNKKKYCDNFFKHDEIYKYYYVLIF